MTELTIQADQTVAVAWKGPRGRGSMGQIMAEGNAERVNNLDTIEIFAICVAVKVAPFPLGKGREVYRLALEQVRADPAAFISEEGRRMPLGEWRRYLIMKAGDGCNAPHDAYLRLADEEKRGLKEYSY